MEAWGLHDYIEIGRNAGAGLDQVDVVEVIEGNRAGPRGSVDSVHPFVEGRHLFVHHKMIALDLSKAITSPSPSIVAKLALPGFAASGGVGLTGTSDQQEVVARKWMLWGLGGEG